ncbi:MAG: hypothetical protein LBN42_02375, partial [Oscillospiraceae bacterium]|nr:hypothetical protein [Oscillospiraceae bacterium]
MRTPVWNKNEYALLDTSDGNRLENWGGDNVIIRPDPCVMWSNHNKPPQWETAAAKFTRINMANTANTAMNGNADKGKLRGGAFGKDGD